MAAFALCGGERVSGGVEPAVLRLKVPRNTRFVLPAPMLLSLLPRPLSATGFLGFTSWLIPLLLLLRPGRLLDGPWLPLFPVHRPPWLLCRGGLRRGSHPVFFPLLPLPLFGCRRPLFHPLPRGSHPGLILSLPLDGRCYLPLSRALKMLSDCLCARLVTILLTS